MGLRVVDAAGGAGEKAPARSGRARVWAWVSGSVATMAAAAGLVVRLLAGPAPVSSSTIEYARELRVQAAAACEKQAWDACEKKLNEARVVDPNGEKDPRVVKERQAIAEHLR